MIKVEKKKAEKNKKKKKKKRKGLQKCKKEHPTGVRESSARRNECGTCCGYLNVRHCPNQKCTFYMCDHCVKKNYEVYGRPHCPACSTLRAHTA